MTTKRLTPLEQEALEVLDRVGCQYFACEGPDKRPKDMQTCMVCRLIRKLKQKVERGEQ